MLQEGNPYAFHKKLALVLGPILLLFFLIASPNQNLKLDAVYGCALLMILWWVAEVVPIYITAMLPMFLFPALGIFTVKETFIPYANPIIFLFLGGFIIALAMEERNLHTRIALGIIRLTGTDPKGIILGFMLATSFLSMWISNTATTVMMLPIALSVVQLLKHQEVDQKLFSSFSLSLLLSIAYSANIGGTITLIGTPPNVVLAGLFEEKLGIEIGFGDWMLLGLPTGIVLLAACYFLITRVLIKVNLAKIKGSSDLFESKRKQLGKMNKAEKLVLTAFLTTALLWCFRGNINAWVGFALLHNTSIAMFGGFLMFTIPVNLNKGEFLLHWKSTQKLPWGILILFGGGLCLANAFESVGIIASLGSWVEANFSYSTAGLILGLTLLSIFATEIMSNVALVTVLLPVVITIGAALNIPFYQICVPVTLAASCAFMMPISTPPNAVIYSSGLVPIHKMVKVGVVLNVIAGLVLSFLVPWLASIVF
ncbi:MAG: SLC13 family permease [Salibacteraceae bacterium]